MNRRRSERASAVGLFEEVFRTVTVLPVSTWALYYAATFPFVLAFLYFWFDMAHHAFAYDRLAGSALGLTVLFIVLKAGHTLYCRRVMATLTCEEESGRPNPFRVAVNQLILQPSGLVALPIAVVFLAPFATVYAFYQNLSALDDGRAPLRETVVRAWRHSGVHPRQNHIAVWLLCPHLVALAAGFFLVLMPLMMFFSPEWTDVFVVFAAGIIVIVLVPLNPLGIVVAVNWAVLLVLLPSLLKTLLGIDTPFTIGAVGMLNPTFFILIAALTYLTLDPVVKIAYTLRCFHAECAHTGHDLRIRLSAIARRAGAAAVVLAAATSCASVAAQDAPISTPTGIDPVRLDGAIDETLEDRQFAWRFPRERPEAAQDNILVQLLQSIGDGIAWGIVKLREFWEWFRGLFPSVEAELGGGGLFAVESTQALLILLLVMLALLLVWIGVRTWRRAQTTEVEVVASVSAAPDLADEQTTADALPANEWLELAQELMERGDVRLAMRAYFFSGLARLGQLDLVRIASHKSNRDYTRELTRVAHAHTELVDTFASATREFEAVWYGDHRPADAEVARFVAAQERIIRHA